MILSIKSMSYISAFAGIAIYSELPKIESDPELGAIYHISVHGVRIKNPQVFSGITSKLPAFPCIQKNA
jgi:hypothetical protein